MSRQVRDHAGYVTVLATKFTKTMRQSWSGMGIGGDPQEWAACGHSKCWSRKRIQN